jgi:hypothetical protein
MKWRLMFFLSLVLLQHWLEWGCQPECFYTIIRYPLNMPNNNTFKTIMLPFRVTASLNIDYIKITFVRVLSGKLAITSPA